MPFVGKILKCIDGVFIDRGNLRQEIQAMKVLGNRLADKKVMFVFILKEQEINHILHL